MARPKAHHTVTAAYLRRFSLESGRKARLWIYQRGKEEPWTQHPSKAATQTNYYSVKLADGSYDDSVEHLLGKVESEALPSIESLSSGETEPSIEDRQRIASFVAFQELRVPLARSAVENMHVKLIESVSEMMARIPGYLVRIVKEQGLEGEYEGTSLEKLREAFTDHDTFQIKVNPAVSLETMLHVAPAAAQWYAMMQWSVLDVPGDNLLFTSDSPVVKRKTRRDNSFYGSGVGLANRFVEVWLPLSVKRLLVISHDQERIDEYSLLVKGKKHKVAKRLRDSKPQTLYGTIPNELIADVRTILAAHADRFVYSPIRDSLIVEALKRPSIAPRLMMG